MLTYPPSLAAKKRYEINHMVEKTKTLKASQAKKAEYGGAGKYVTFTDKAGNKAAISINQGAILICYLTVLLERLFQSNILENELIYTL